LTRCSRAREDDASSLQKEKTKRLREEIKFRNNIIKDDYYKKTTEEEKKRKLMTPSKKITTSQKEGTMAR
jgi:hypothetical protein